MTTTEVMKMDQCRLTSLSEVAEEEFLFKLFETPCFPRCDLTTITGPAKSGKTYVVSMLMACCVKRQVLAFERIREEPLKVVWLDTEQSRMTTKRILTERIGKMTGDTDGFPDEQFYALNVRGQTPEERAFCRRNRQQSRRGARRTAATGDDTGQYPCAEIL